MTLRKLPKNDGWADIDYDLGQDPDDNARIGAILNEACHVFHYHAGLITQRAEVHGVTGCRWLLVQAPAVRHSADDPGAQWTEVWEGRRPRDAERYRLYVRN